VESRVLLNQTAVYALRAMAALANLAPAETLRASELAGRTGVPVHYLAKVMRRLVLAGLVQSRKGHGGGFALSRPPRAITIENVLVASDAAPEAGQCAFGWGACDTERPCPLHPTWSRLLESITTWARQTTLEMARTEDFTTLMAERTGEPRHR